MYKILDNGSDLSTDSGYPKEYNTLEGAREALNEYIETEYPINTDGHLYDITKEEVVESFEAVATVTLKKML